MYQRMCGGLHAAVRTGTLHEVLGMMSQSDREMAEGAVFALVINAIIILVLYLT